MTRFWRREGQRRGASHDEKVARIADALRRWPAGRPLSLRKKAVSHQVPKGGDAKYTDARIDIGDLNEILAIDPATRTCVAEPGVTFVDLVSATLKFGLVPAVVPELKTITVGGAVSGCSIESSSFRVGGFHDSCLAYEVITADGDVLTCTPDNEHRLLFQMLHGTFGTLAIISKLTFRLLPAKPFVHVVYEKHGDLAAFMLAIQRHFDAGDVDFIDGMIHSPSELVLCLGRFVDRAPYTNRYDWLKVYYRSTRERRDDYLATPDYFFRYDRGVTNVHPSSFIGRLFLGKLIGSSELLRLAEKFQSLLRSDRPNLTLDVFIPFSRVPEFFDWHCRVLGHFPLWCVPYRRVHDYEWLSDDFYRGLGDQLFLDLAIYGMKQPRGGPNYYRLVEEQLLKVGGMKTLISHNYFSEDEFWRIWNKPNYQRAKAIGDPRHLFRDLYEKTCRASQGK